MKVFWVSYVHELYNEDEIPSVDNPIVVEAASHKSAANQHASQLAEGSADDGLLVIGPVEGGTSPGEAQFFKLVPPRRVWGAEPR